MSAAPGEAASRTAAPVQDPAVTSYWNDTPTSLPPTGPDPSEAWASSEALPPNPQRSADHPPVPGHPLPPIMEPAIGALDERPQFAAPMPPPPPPRTSLPPSPRGSGARVALVALVMIALVGAGYVGRGLVDAEGGSPVGSPGGGAPSGTADEPSTPLLSGTGDEPVKAVARALGPSVVVVRIGEDLGSGVIYDRTGLIITNAHVVGTASSVTVTLNDGRSVAGAVVGADAAADIAVVRLELPADLPAARLATSPPEGGDLVVALGSPFGLDQTITSGVVSAVNRPVDNGAGGYVDMIQTDAAINPGNSGGALANRRAEVVGINSMIYSQSGANSGVGFAIPIDKAKSVADHLVSGQRVDRAYLGVRSQATDDGTPGAQVASVEPGSGAERGGLAAGDVVIAVDGLVVKDPTDLAGAVAAHEPGETVTMAVRRGDQQTELPVVLGASAPTTADPAARGRTPRTPNRPG
jgi:putative serine protease PepD